MGLKLSEMAMHMVWGSNHTGGKTEQKMPDRGEHVHESNHPSACFGGTTPPTRAPENRWWIQKHRIPPLRPLRTDAFWWVGGGRVQREKSQTVVFNAWFLGRPEIADFWGSSRPRRARNPFPPVGRFAAHRVEGVFGSPRPPGPENQRFPAGPKTMH